jgi:hypothetical protein
VLQFIMPLKPINNQNLGFIEQKMYFWTRKRGSINKKIFVFVMKIFFRWPFQSYPLLAYVSTTQRCASPFCVHFNEGYTENINLVFNWANGFVIISHSYCSGTTSKHKTIFIVLFTTKTNIKIVKLRKHLKILNILWIIGVRIWNISLMTW